MSLDLKTIVLASTLVVGSSASAWAFGGIGCADLPEYDRAQGALEGMTGACDMSVEQARRIVAAQGQPAVVAEPGQSPQRRHHRHRRALSRPISAE